MAFSLLAGTPNNGLTSAVTYTNPSHQAGDLLYLVVESGATTGIVTPPSGWAHVTGSPRAQGSNVTSVSVMWKRATTSSETNPVSPAQANHQVGFVLRVRGAIASGDPHDGTQGDGGTSQTSLVATGVNTTVDGDLMMCVMAGNTDIATDQFSNPTGVTWTGLTILAQSWTTQGNGGGVGIITGEKAVAGPPGTLTVTAATSMAWSGITLAVMPEPVAVGWPIIVQPPRR